MSHLQMDPLGGKSWPTAGFVGVFMFGLGLAVSKAPGLRRWTRAVGRPSGHVPMLTDATVEQLLPNGACH